MSDLVTEGMDANAAATSADTSADTSTTTETTTTETTTTTADIPKFHDGFKADLKGHEALMPFTNPSDLGQAFVDLKGKSDRSIELIGEDASPEQRSEYLKKLGRPDSSGEYDLTVQAPQGVSITDEFAASFKEIAFNQGLTQAQAKDLFGDMVKVYGEGLNQTRKLVAQSKLDAAAALRADWGDSYDSQMAHVKSALQKFGSPELIGAIRDSGIGNDPSLSRFLAKIGSLTAEDTSSLTQGNRTQVDLNNPKKSLEYAHLPG